MMISLGMGEELDVWLQKPREELRMFNSILLTFSERILSAWTRLGRNMSLQHTSYSLSEENHSENNLTFREIDFEKTTLEQGKTVLGSRSRLTLGYNPLLWMNIPED